MDQVRGWCTALRNLYQSVRDLSKPAVAAWNGIAAGAGHADRPLLRRPRVRIPPRASASQRCAPGLASIVGTYFMSLYVGHGANRELSLSGGLVSGERAHTQSASSTIWSPRGEVLTKAIAIAEESAEGAAGGHAAHQGAPARADATGLR
jgi:enoyl-CoA hydratase/carnithine racemase